MQRFLFKLKIWKWTHKYENKKKTSDQKKSNVIHNLKYVSSDKNGNNYIITSKNGELNDNKPEIILMSNVIATINMKDSKPITIS